MGDRWWVGRRQPTVGVLWAAIGAARINLGAVMVRVWHWLKDSNWVVLPCEQCGYGG